VTLLAVGIQDEDFHIMMHNRIIQKDLKRIRDNELYLEKQLAKTEGKARKAWKLRQENRAKGM
jgi:hypothetical protein